MNPRILLGAVFFWCGALAACGQGPDAYQTNPILKGGEDHAEEGGDDSEDDQVLGPQGTTSTQNTLGKLGSHAAPEGNSPPSDWEVDPCKVLKPTVKASGKNSKGQTMFIGTDGADVIFGTEDADFIDGKKGVDVICGRDGEDTIFGGMNNDYIDGGAGIDTIDAGGGNDIVHGRAGSDVIHGGTGNDYLNGDILDDDIYGDDGNDVLIGGHGSDNMHGGKGDDYLRGDTGRDEFVGGDGIDTASFATAMPPGQYSGGGDGVVVNLNPVATIALKVLGDKKATVGFAWGDGVKEPTLGIDRVVGSPFADSLDGPAGTELIGGLGHDTCRGAPCDDPSEVELGSSPYVGMDVSDHDPGLLIVGTGGVDSLDLQVTSTGIRVEANQALQLGPLCSPLASEGTNVAECKLPGDMFFVSIWGGAGDDDITIGNRLGRNTTSHASGGPDTDVVYGGDGEDVLFTGDTGADQLMGNAGDDALLSESNGTDQAALGPAYNGGPDTLDGGAGDDQLVSDYPCGGHKFFGGDGFDIAGFARVADTMHIRAQLGGDTDIQDRSEFWGRALSPERCAGQKNLWTELDPHLEVLEGAELSDELFGDDQNNVIWGRGGGDTIRGYGGNDWLDGHKGNDVIYGGKGKDWIHGGDDYDYLHAQDGQSDGEVSCGTGGGKLSDSDSSDPGGGCD